MRKTCLFYSWDTQPISEILSKFSMGSNKWKRNFNKIIEDHGIKEDGSKFVYTILLDNQLKPRTFTWKDRRANRGDSVGFIAQEVKSVISDNTLVQGEEYDPDNLKMTGLSLNTIGLVAYLTKAIQELSAKNDALEARITTLEG